MAELLFIFQKFFELKRSKQSKQGQLQIKTKNKENQTKNPTLRKKEGTKD